MDGLFDSVDAYEAAFSYRNLPDEVDLLLTWFSRHHGGVPGSVLELASGPGDHALEFARRGIGATALDLSAAMCALAAERAAAAGPEVDVVRADMTDFRLDRRFDLAILMLDSAALLLTEEAMGAHQAASTGSRSGTRALHLSVTDSCNDAPGALSENALNCR